MIVRARWLLVLSLAACADVSNVDDFRFFEPTPPPCEPDDVQTTCADVACGSVINNCDEEVACDHKQCPGVMQCEVNAPANSCGCTSGLAPPATPEACTGPFFGGQPDHAYYVCGRLELDPARAFCQSFGTDLTIIGDQLENDFVYSLVPLHNETIRIGLADPECNEPPGTPCEFATWIDGSMVTFAPWKNGEPNNSIPGEKCVELDARDQSPPVGEWNDVACGNPQLIVCETTCR